MSIRLPHFIGMLVATVANIAAAPGALAQADVIRTKEITRLSPKASVVLDRNCPDIVQPYTLADNTASLALFGAKEAISDVGARLLANAGSILAGNRPTLAPTTSKLTASTKLAAKQLNWSRMTLYRKLAKYHINRSV